jgi:hypothetical protein
MCRWLAKRRGRLLGRAPLLDVRYLGRLQPRRFTDEERRWKRDHDHQDAEIAQRAAPPEGDDERVRQNRHERATDSDAEVRHAHRPAPGVAEPARQQDLGGQRPAADVPERVQEVEQIEAGEGRHAGQPYQCEPRHHDASEHQPSDAEPVDDRSCQEAEHRADDHLAERVARRDLLRVSRDPGRKVVEKRQPVRCDRRPRRRDERRRQRAELDRVTRAYRRYLSLRRRRPIAASYTMIAPRM